VERTKPVPGVTAGAARGMMTRTPARLPAMTAPLVGFRIMPRARRDIPWGMTSTSRSRLRSVTLAAALALPLCAHGAANGTAAKPASGPYVHQLQLAVAGARAEVRLNGFPLGEASSGSSFSAPVNPYLAGKRNALEIVVDAAPGPDGKPLPLRDVRVEATVRRFVQGAIVEPGAGEVVTQYVAPATAVAELASGKRKPPLTLTHPFSNQGPDFSAELLDTAPFADEAALRDYAMKLRGLAEKRDVDALLVEFGPKVRAYAAAYAKPEATFWDGLRGAIARIVEQKPDLAYGRDDVEPRACSGGRVWELRRKGGLPLLRTVPDSDGKVAQLRVFVAPRDGALRVVR